MPRFNKTKRYRNKKGQIFGKGVWLSDSGVIMRPGESYDVNRQKRTVTQYNSDGTKTVFPWEEWAKKNSKENELRVLMNDRKWGIPDIQEKKMTLTIDSKSPTSRNRGASFPENMLDSIAVNAKRAGLSFGDAIGMVSAESTFGSGERSAGQSMLPVLRHLSQGNSKQKQQATEVSYDGIYSPSLLVSNWSQRNEDPFHAYFYGSNGQLLKSPRTEEYYDKDFNATRNRNDKYYLKDVSPLESAFRQYAEDPYSYNPADPLYPKKVEANKKELTQYSPEIISYMKKNNLHSSGGALSNIQTPWNKLSISEKADIMKVAVQNGITNLADIKDRYNEFAEGGDLTEDDYFSIENENEYSSGGKIHIKPSHRGRLTELKKRTGKSEAELYNDGNPAHKKMVVFARNSRKWKHADGGNLYPGGGLIGLIPAIPTIAFAKTAANPAKSLVRKNLYENLTPVGYSDIPTVVKAAIGIPDYFAHAGHPTRDDFWAEYLEIPKEKRHKIKGKITISPSMYRPTKGKPNPRTFRIDNLSDKNKEMLIDAAKGLNIGENRQLGYSDQESPFEGLGRFTVGKGHDSKGTYISYYDEWNLSPFSNREVGGGGAEDESFGIGSPFDVYDRIYLDDYLGIPAENRGSYFLPEVEVVAPKRKSLGGPLVDAANAHIYDGTTEDSQQMNRKTVYKSKLGRVFKTREEAVEDNKRYYKMREQARDRNILATPSEEIQKAERGIQGARQHAAWEEEHPVATQWGNVLGATPLAIAAYPAASVAGSGLMALGDATAATATGQALTSALAPVATAATTEYGGVPAWMWADAALTAGFGGHGINTAIKEGGISPETALEIAPLFQVAKPATQLAKEGLGKLTSSNKYPSALEYAYSRNPKLGEIGTIDDYNEYLKTIFPESKVQDINYHMGPKGLQELKPSTGEVWNTNPGARGIYVTPERSYAEKIRKFTTDRLENPSIFTYMRRNVTPGGWKTPNEQFTDIYPVMVNTRNPLQTRGTWTWGIKDDKYNTLMSQYDGIVNGGPRWWENANKMPETIVPKTEQTFILGTDADVAGFTKYMKPQLSDEAIKEAFDKAYNYKHSDGYAKLIEKARKESIANGTGTFPDKFFFDGIYEERPTYKFEELPLGKVATHNRETNTISFDPRQIKKGEEVPYHEALHWQHIGHPDIGTFPKRDAYIKAKEVNDPNMVAFWNDYHNSPEYQDFKEAWNLAHYYEDKINKAVYPNIPKDAEMRKPWELSIHGREAGEALGIEPFAEYPGYEKALEHVKKARKYDSYLNDVKADSEEEVKTFWEILTGNFIPSVAGGALLLSGMQNEN